MARTARSKHFAAALKTVIEEDFDGNMTRFAEKAKTPLGTIGHYLRPTEKGRFPSAEKLEALISAVPTREGRVKLFQAYIADMVPKSLMKEVAVVPRKGDGAPLDPSQGVTLPPSTRDALQFLADLAADNLQVKRMLESTAKAMRGAM